MKRYLNIFWILLLTLAAFAPAAHAQIYVSSTATVDTADTSAALLECSAELFDTADYPGVEAVCSLASPNGTYDCNGGVIDGTSDCWETVNIIPGGTYQSTGAHYVDFYGVYNDDGTFAYWYDPEGFACNSVLYPGPSGTVEPNTCLSFPDGNPILVAITDDSFTAIQITPTSATLKPSQTQQFTANIPVTWVLTSGSGSIDNNGLYTAPNASQVGNGASATIRGCDVNNSDNCQYATIQINTLNLSISPDTVDLNAGQAQIFTVTSNDPSIPNPSMNWSISPAGTGTLSGSGNTATYTAPPANPAAPITLTITGAYTADTSKTVTATVNLVPVSVQINAPTPVFLASPGATTPVSAMVSGWASNTPPQVTWKAPTVGTMNPSTGDVVSYVAPSTAITSQQTVLIDACVQTASGATAVCASNSASTATLTLVPPVIINPIIQALPAGQQSLLTINGSGFGTNPTVTFSDSNNISWSLLSATPNQIQGFVTVQTMTPGEFVTVTVADNGTPLAVAPTGTSNPITVVPAVIAISMTPGSTTLDEGQQAQFSETITCKTSTGTVCTVPQTATWNLTLISGSAGSGLGSITSGGLYTAPASIPVAAIVGLKACAAISPTVCTSPSQISLVPLIVTLNPGSADVDGGQTAKFQASATGLPSGIVASYNWSFVPGQTPAPIGTIDSTGLYTAPTPILTAQNILVQACITFDTTKCGVATMILTPAVVTITPSAAVTSYGGGSQQYQAQVSGAPQASVTWSIPKTAPGSITATGGLYTAPATVTAQTTFLVSACSTSYASVCATVSLTLDPPPDFGLTATPASQTVVVGGSASYTVSTSALYGFNGATTLSVTNGLPAGANATFNPNPVNGAGNSALTVTTSGSTPAGSYTLTITGTSGTNVHTTTVTLIVADFSIAVTPNSQTVTNNGTTTYTVTVTPINGFNFPVTLAAPAGLPAGTTYSYSANPINGSGASTLTITTSSSTPTGSWPITMTGSSGPDSHSATVTLVGVDFSIAPTPGSQTVVANSCTTYTVPVTALNGFSGVVNLSVTGLPTGATGTFNPNSISGSGTSTLTVCTSSATPAAVYPLAIVAASGSDSHSATVSLSVQNFVLTVTPASQAVSQGGCAVLTITVANQNGFNGSISFSGSGIPPGATTSLSGSTGTICTSTSTPPGTYTITVIATSGTLSHSVPVTLTVGDFSMGALNPGSQSTSRGGSVNYTVSVAAGAGFSGNVALSVSGLPSGVTGSFAPASINTSGSSVLTLTTSSTMAVGTYNFTVTGASGSDLHSVTGTLTVSYTITTVRPTTYAVPSIAYTSYSNPGNAMDGNSNTYAGGPNGSTLNGDIWSGFGSVSGTANAVALNVTSAAKNGTSSGYLIGLWYSLDGGNTWNTIYTLAYGNCYGMPGCSTAASRALQTDVINLPTNQNLANVKVEAFVDGGNPASQQIYDIWLSVTH